MNGNVRCSRCDNEHSTKFRKQKSYLKQKTNPHKKFQNKIIKKQKDKLAHPDRTFMMANQFPHNKQKKQKERTIIL